MAPVRGAGRLGDMTEGGRTVENAGRRGDLRRGGARRAVGGLCAAGVAVMGLVTGCGMDLRDHECQANEYPVQAVGVPGSGACVTKGKEPPDGDVRYPPGEVPQRVGDKWDVYWDSHAMDADGHLIKK